MINPKSPTAQPASPIFADGFESGDVCNWTQAVGAVPAPNCPKPQSVTANSTYSSEGKLLKLAHENPTEGTEDITLFYFGERPVALRELVNDVETWKWITTDHLGTPIALTSSNGTPLWRGGFEPYGQDFAGATAAGMFLRLPGQWTDPAWETSGLGAGVYYNVHRWYEGPAGRYTSPGPLLSLRTGLAPIWQNHAERLTRVEEQGGSGRTLEEFFYDASGFVGAHANGKLTIAVRHNWVQVSWAPLGTIIDPAVTQKPTYKGRDGRPSERMTSVALEGLELRRRRSPSR